MPRDWEIIRAILVRLEESSTPKATVNMKDFEDIDEQSVGYNMWLLSEEGCIDASIMESSRGDNLIKNAIAFRLKPRGHNLLDSIRNENLWNQIKKRFQSKGLDMTIDMVITVGKRIMESMLT